VRSNPSLKPRPSGMAPWPRGAVLHPAPRGQGTLSSNVRPHQTNRGGLTLCIRVATVQTCSPFFRQKSLLPGLTL